MLAMTYDATTKIFNGYVEVADENSVPANATLVKPNGIVQPYTWDGVKWTGQSIDDWNTQNNNQEATPQPSVEQQMIMAQVQQLSTMQQMMMAQAADLAALKTIKEAE